MNEIPSWFQFGLGFVLAIGAAWSGSIAATIRITKRLNEMETHFVKGLSDLKFEFFELLRERTHELGARMQNQVIASEKVNERIENKFDLWVVEFNNRCGAIEQKQAVFDDFKRRAEDRREPS